MGEIQYIANLPKLNNTKLGKLKSSIIKAIDWLNTKWMLKVLLQFLPMIWTSLILKIEFFARLLYNDEGNLNEYGIKIGVTIYLLSLAVMLLTSFKTHRDQKRAQLGDANKLAMESELRIWKTVSNAECDVEGNRINSILKYSTKISKAGVIDTQRMKIGDCKSL